MKEKLFIGIDVSKNYLDIFISNTEKSKIKNSISSAKKIAERCKKLDVELVVLEATGGYEQIVVEALHGSEVAVSVVNPRQIKNFARSLGKNAKNDLLDAEILCLFAQKMNPRRTKPLDSASKELKSLVLRRGQLTDALAAEKNRLKAPATTESVKESVEEFIDFIKKQIKSLDKKIKSQVEANDDFAKKDKLLQNTQGVGKTMSAVLIALVPELGQINRKEIAALIGVAPFNNDSGSRVGKRSIYGGRAHVRSVLYMATITAIRKNPCIRNFYLRLKQSGKPSKITIVACMRKLLTALNAMIRDSKEWSDSRYLTQKA